MSELLVYVLLVRFEVLSGHEAAFDALAAEALAQIRVAEPGTVVYVLHRRLDRPLERVFYEAYVDEAAFDAHERSAHVQHFLAERAQHLVADPEVWVLHGEGLVRAVADPGG